ncbi:hypothetical protein CP533_3707 [Ophiocordyceps camponoti-saundersi (nom. inval.)]|nr:hypothetical protein CP533_3707 [Ophiocordyceps camponoti-saundersi (nom. inval.)]
MRYLHGTKSLGLTLGDNLHIRYSIAGYIVFVSIGPVHWKSKRQTLITLSLTEAEFINLTPVSISLI